MAIKVFRIHTFENIQGYERKILFYIYQVLQVKYETQRKLLRYSLNQLTELDVLFILLYVSGVLKDTQLTISDIWPKV